MSILYQVTLNNPPACGGVVISESTGNVVDSAPIFKWMIGSYWSMIKIWISQKGGSWKEINKEK